MLLAIAIAFALVVAFCGVDIDNAAAPPGHDDCSMQAATGASSPPVPYPVARVVSVGLPVLPLRASGTSRRRRRGPLSKAKEMRAHAEAEHRSGERDPHRPGLCRGGSAHR